NPQITQVQHPSAVGYLGQLGETTPKCHRSLALYSIVRYPEVAPIRRVSIADLGSQAWGLWLVTLRASVERPAFVRCEDRHRVRLPFPVHGWWRRTLVQAPGRRFA